MVTLSRIYTRTGDGGQTRLGDNQQVAKWDARVEAYGAVDEVSCHLGLVLAAGAGEESTRILRAVQHDLFDLGADLSTPRSGDGDLRIEAAQVSRLEEEIDRLNAGLQPLRSFVLPGGDEIAARLHLARAVCRRAERRAWELASREASGRPAAGQGSVNEQALIYLNRLSDLLFVLARAHNDLGCGDLLWEPGKTREG
ncbi:cob(I)yrinic acid a,c-diamide adenosyltransferase [Candidatus Latescibacterota bacterium]